MKKFFTSVSLLVAAMMISPNVDGQSRGRNNLGGSKPATSSAVRPGNMGNHNRPGNNNTATHPGNNRPGNNFNPGQSNRPGNNTPTTPPANNRPGNNFNPGQSNRPGNSTATTPPANNRPGTNFNPGQSNRPGNSTPTTPPGNNRPGNNFNPGQSNRPGYNRPTPPPANNRPTPPPSANRPGPVRPPHSVPYRPYLPANRPWVRPTPPPSFRPYGPVPRFNSIFNISFGTALNISLNMLTNSGYTVSGYGSDAIYLSNVNQFGYIWPSATLQYYNGVLTGSEFVYSSPGYDMSRYNLLYNKFVNQYGYPVSSQNNGSGNVSVTWWGYNNAYVTLSFYPDYAYNGSYRYYTTVQIGN